jgi:hypothetical protein
MNLPSTFGPSGGGKAGGFETFLRIAIATVVVLGALGLIVSYWDDISKAIGFSNAEQLKLIESTNKYYETLGKNAQATRDKEITGLQNQLKLVQANREVELADLALRKASRKELESSESEYLKNVYILNKQIAKENVTFVKADITANEGKLAVLQEQAKTLKNGSDDQKENAKNQESNLETQIKLTNDLANANADLEVADIKREKDRQELLLKRKNANEKDAAEAKQRELDLQKEKDKALDKVIDEAAARINQ